ncbi:MAG: alpha/beta fold hydrolase [Acidimicrobiales bacterium]
MATVGTSDGLTLAVHDLGGPPTAPGLLLAHATGFHGRMYQPMVDAGLVERFRCFAPDLRGHGDSAATPAQVSDWNRFGTDVLAVVDQLERQNARLYGFGHSMGGAALLMAELLRPGTFAALWLFEPIVAPPSSVSSEGPNPMAEAAARRREVFESVAAAIANYASKPPLDVFTPEAMAAYVEHGFASQPDGTVRLKCRGAVEAATYRGAGTQRTFDRLGEIACPVVVGVGAPVSAGPSAFAAAAAAAMPHGSVERFEHLTHFAPQQAPAELAGAVLNAFSRQ